MKAFDIYRAIGLSTVLLCLSIPLAALKADQLARGFVWVCFLDDLTPQDVHRSFIFSTAEEAEADLKLHEANCTKLGRTHKVMSVAEYKELGFPNVTPDPKGTPVGTRD